MCNELKFDDLSPEEQDVYLRAAQRLLDEEDDGPCGACGAEMGEHRLWCRRADNGMQEAA